MIMNFFFRISSLLYLLIINLILYIYKPIERNKKIINENNTVNYNNIKSNIINYLSYMIMLYIPYIIIMSIIVYVFADEIII